MHSTQKLKIFNDPVYGFISIPDRFIFTLIEQPQFQRLRRISQTGLSYYVYPGATHSRFLHALGCLHLMQKAVNTLRQKGVEITKNEERGVYIAILLHDVGHGPFSHALENTIVEGVHHENISLQIMQELNSEFNGELEIAIQLFKNEYPKKFLSQLISSQLDVDRLDYLKRDSFFSGVAEGNINSDRIISMMNVADDNLVIDVKGIYSIEKYLISRMFMYWQVYLHKTSVAAEIYLIQALKRAKELYHSGESIKTTYALRYFLDKENYNQFSSEDLAQFCSLDDNDVIYSLKEWQHHHDLILRSLSAAIIQRRLPKAEIRKNSISKEEIQEKRNLSNELFGEEVADWFIHETQLSIKPYDLKSPIKLWQKNGEVVDLENSQQQILSKHLFETTSKYHFCYWDQAKFKQLAKVI